MRKTTSEEKQKAKEDLIKMFSKDKEIVLYTTVKHVSRSGMMRHIDVIYINENKQPQNINWYIETLGLFNRAKSYNSKNADSLRVGGCGMDIGFHVVSTLSSRLFGDYKKITQRWL